MPPSPSLWELTFSAGVKTFCWSETVGKYRRQFFPSTVLLMLLSSWLYLYIFTVAPEKAKDLQIERFVSFFPQFFSPSPTFPTHKVIWEIGPQGCFFIQTSLYSLPCLFSFSACWCTWQRLTTFATFKAPFTMFGDWNWPGKVSFINNLTFTLHNFCRSIHNEVYNDVQRQYLWDLFKTFMTF